jgi:hypothetical protein
MQDALSPSILPFMQRALTFIGIGTLVALAVEAAFNLLAAHTFANFLFTLFFYPAYLALFYGLQTRVLFPLVARPRIRFLLTYILGGVCGLAIEWFIIGNSPWAHPEALQWGMWVYWASVVSVPTLYQQDAQRGMRVISYTILLYGGGALVLARVFPPGMQLFLQPVWQTCFFTALLVPYLLFLRSRKSA